MSSITGGEGGAGQQVIPVIVLNWNGEDDTLECLKSIRQSVPAGFMPVVVDNGSEPASAERLKRACSSVYTKMLCLDTQELLGPPEASHARLANCLDSDSLVFIQSGENLGFAKGSNMGLRLAERIGAEWVMLLNNDTVVTPSTFLELRKFLATTPSAVAITPQIRYLCPATRIQNCGGRLTYLGSRRYRFADADAAALPSTPYSVVSFATGCALLFKYGMTGALTEDFFFGEEDYEFALRLERLGLQMVCLHGAVVHHKVGTTVRKSARPLGGILVQYVCRLINVRNYYSRIRWHLTRIAAYLYLPVLLAKNGVNPLKTLSMIRRIEAYLARHHTVGRAEFQSMIASSW